MALSKYIMQPVVGRDVQRYASLELQKIERAIATIIDEVTKPLEWIDVTYQNGWGTLVAPNFVGAQYAKDISNRVYLRGLMYNGAVGSPAFTLPAGYRPAYTNLFAVISNDALGKVDVKNNGDVTPTLPSVFNYVCLDQISFFAEQ
jgi:hypothetical protein